jgi:hypothetical protein
MAIQVSGSSAPSLASYVTPPTGKTYGQNAPQPSSVKCSESADLSALKVTPKDGARDLILANKHHPILSEDSNDWQVRQIAGAPATHPHMSKPDGSPSGTVGLTPARPVKK